MADTYSSKPFISYDGIDEKGVRAEVMVIKGYGNIFDMDPSTAGKSINVTFKVDNTRFKSNGWAPTDGNVIKKVEEAKLKGVPIHFRIEKHRKKHVDRTTPIQELSGLANAKDNIFKSLAAVKIEGEDEWTISPHALTRLEEDPNTGGANSAYAHSLEELGIGRKPTASRPRSNNSRGVEAPPYSSYNDDGSVNLGSIAVSVPLNLFSFVVEYERTHEDTLTLTEKQRAALARLLLNASNDLQMSIYDEEDQKLEKPDLSAGSHTRARALLFESIRTFYPLTTEIVTDKASLKEWRDNLVAKSLAMWKWGVAEFKRVEEKD